MKHALLSQGQGMATDEEERAQELARTASWHDVDNDDDESESGEESHSNTGRWQCKHSLGPRRCVVEK
jgi:hypothetical protein